MSTLEDVTTASFDVSRLASSTWKLFAARPVEHVLAGFVVLILSAVSLGVLAGPLLVGWYRMCAKQQDGLPIQLGDVFSGFDRFLPALLGLVLIAIGVAVGLVFLVVPGVVLAIGWMFFLPFVALRGQGPVEALGSSWRLFRRKPSETLTVFVLLTVLEVIGGGSVILTLLAVPLGIISSFLAFETLAE